MAKCSIRALHIPPAPAPDSHHLIPQAWQRFWRPTTGVGAVWYPLLVEVCPNCHRRIHDEIVLMMKTQSKTPALAREAVYGNKRLTREAAQAYRALVGWSEVGGDLEALYAARLWGQQ